VGRNFVVKEWRAKEVEAAALLASALAIEQATEEAVTIAQSPFPKGAPRDTGFMADHLRPVKPRIQGSKVIGGMDGEAFYTIFQELRYGFMRRALDETAPRVPEYTRRYFR